MDVATWRFMSIYLRLYSNTRDCNTLNIIRFSKIVVVFVKLIFLNFSIHFKSNYILRIFILTQLLYQI